MSSKWVSMKQACDIFDVSLSTLRRRIESGEIESRLEGRRRLVLILDDTSSDTSTTQELTQSALIEQLRSEVERLTEQLERKDEQLATLEQSRERQDTIMLHLTRQLEQSQRLLEYHKEPFWRRWFKRRRREDSR